ncbi:MAG: LytTR family DNA-binding domain-containing protein [Bacteroidota bacterium]
MVSILTGLFMFIVLYVYKAYNIEQVDSFSGHSLLFRAVAHALLTSLLFFTAEFFIKPYFNLNTRGKAIAWIVVIIFVGINLTFLLFNYFWLWTELSWSSYSLFCYEYPLVVVIPIVIAKLAGSQKRKVKISDDEMIAFESENGKNNLRIKPECLYYLKSSDNYVEVYYVLNDEVKKHLLRASLKQIEEGFAGSPHLIRCHRSYMINPKNIRSIVQTSQMINLNMDYFNVPVSKKYQSSFK